MNENILRDYSAHKEFLGPMRLLAPNSSNTAFPTLSGVALAVLGLLAYLSRRLLKDMEVLIRWKTNGNMFRTTIKC